MVGGTVGGVVVAILLLLVAGVVIALFIMRRSKRKTGSINILAMSNATYDGNKLLFSLLCHIDASCLHNYEHMQE